MSSSSPTTNESNSDKNTCSAPDQERNSDLLSSLPPQSQEATIPQSVCDNTMLDVDRLYRLHQYATIAGLLGGDFAEVGVARGGSALFLAQHLMAGQKLYIFDTFAGLPNPGEFDTHKPGEFAGSFGYVMDLLRPYPVEVFQGVFPQDTAWALDGKYFSLVHLDCDLYDGVKAGLDLFGPHMVSGGMIVLDDVYCPDCPGALKAAQEYCREHDMQLFNRTGPQAVLQF